MKDFCTDESFENGGILYVFPAFKAARMDKKTRHSAADGLFRGSQERHKKIGAAVYSGSGETEIGETWLFTGPA